MSARKYVPPYKVSGRAMNLIAEINKAKGKAYEATTEKTTEKTTKKTAKKSSVKIMDVMKSMPDVTLAELSNATGLSVDGVRWNIRKLKDANLIRRVGPDKGGHWEVVK